MGTMPRHSIAQARTRLLNAYRLQLQFILTIRRITIMSKRKVTIKALRTESPWAIAERLGVQYTGDMNPIPHWGCWYATHDWHHGYAECVRITESEGHLWLERGTINCPTRQGEIEAALKCNGVDMDEYDNADQATRNLIEIESCLSYSGCEVDQNLEFETIDGESCGDYPEFRIFQAAVPMLLAIAPPKDRNYAVRYACTGATIGFYFGQTPKAAIRKALRERPEYRDRKGELYAELV